MKKKTAARAIALALAAALMLAGPLTSSGAASGAQNASETGAAKLDSAEEVVYARLGADGAPYAVYVVGVLNAGSEGTVERLGDFTDVRSLTSTLPAEYADGTAHFGVKKGVNYVQVSLASTELPWRINADYTLDGKPVTAEELAGASGRFALRLSLGKNENCEGGYYAGCMLQISVALPAEKCENISAPGAAAANSGGDRLYTFTVMPGDGADISVSADVHDFEMSGISIAAVKYTASLDMDLSGLTGQFDELIDASAQLSDGAAQLSDGAVQLESGLSGLKGGSSQFDSGMKTLSESAASLESGSAQILGALGALDGAGELEGLEGLGTQLSALAEGLGQLAAAARSISDGLTQLSGGYSQAFAALDAAISAIPEGTVTEEEITALYAANPTNKALLALIDNYKAAQTVRGTYAATRAAFAGAAESLPTLASSLSTLAGELEKTAGGLSESLGSLPDLGGLASLAQGAGQLAANYKSFDKGLRDFTGGVKKLADSYAKLDNGIAQSASGASELASGTEKYADGAAEFADGAESIPDRVQSEVDSLVAGFTGEDFTPESFMSRENGEVDAIQFVIQLDGVSAPEKAAETTDEAPQTFWQRFLALFGA